MSDDEGDLSHIDVGVGAPSHKRDRGYEFEEIIDISDGSSPNVRPSTVPHNNVTSYSVTDFTGQRLRDIPAKLFYESLSVGDTFEFRGFIRNSSAIADDVVYTLYTTIRDRTPFATCAVFEVNNPLDKSQKVNVSLGFLKRLCPSRFRRAIFEVVFKGPIGTLTKKYISDGVPTEPSNKYARKNVITKNITDFKDDEDFVRPQKPAPIPTDSLKRKGRIPKRLVIEEVDYSVQTTVHPTTVHPTVRPIPQFASYIPTVYPTLSVTIDQATKVEVVKSVTDNIWTQRTVAAMVDKYTPIIVKTIIENPEARRDALIKIATEPQIQQDAINMLLKDHTVIQAAIDQLKADPTFQESMSTGAFDSLINMHNIDSKVLDAQIANIVKKKLKK